MSEKTILVIDDSATIRRLVDSYLSPAGYRVVLAATAEEGLKLAGEIRPHLILLDHQLPGTTGFEVCTQLAQREDTGQIPVVVSSTLRKRAYVEYAELPNVVDMLPKPYTADLLQTTVANALDTGAMVVASQQQGTAVPEVIDELGEPELTGTFTHFSLREVLDFLTNAEKQGVLEVESEQRRTLYFLSRGRIGGVTASGVDAAALMARLPDALQSLGPVMKLTMTSRASSELSGIMELLDRKVIDPRLLRKLLRFQAAALTFDGFHEQPRAFRFQATDALPPLQQKLPLDTSLMALCLEGALHAESERLPGWNADQRFARRMFRGQNLDRAGVAARHINVLGLLNEPLSLEEISGRTGWDPEETKRVLYGLSLVEAVAVHAGGPVTQLLVLEPDGAVAGQLRAFFAERLPQVHAKVVRDRLAWQLILKRMSPNITVVDLARLGGTEPCRVLCDNHAEKLAAARWIVLAAEGEPTEPSHWQQQLNVPVAAVLPNSWDAEQLAATVESLLEDPETYEAVNENPPQPTQPEPPPPEPSYGEACFVVET